MAYKRNKNTKERNDKQYNSSEQMDRRVSNRRKSLNEEKNRNEILK